MPAQTEQARFEDTRFEDMGVPLYEVTFVVVDLETTGLSPGRDRITEIGAVKVHGGDRIGEFSSLVSPGVPLPPAITALTGITEHMLAGAPPISALLPSFLEFTRDAVLVAHNAPFDVGFLNAELGRLNHPQLANEVVDTARLARRLVRDEVRNLRLETLATHLRSRFRPTHRALADARATVDVLHGLLERAAAYNVMTLEDVHDFCRSSSQDAFQKVDLVKLAREEPGVYRFRDDRGEVLYVGKTINLRRRLRTYFGQDPRRRMSDMVRETSTVDWTVTATGLEAEVLELREIRERQPRYNRRSRNSRVAYLKLTNEPFPRLAIVWSQLDDGATYMGPFGSRRAAEVVQQAVFDTIAIRQCTPRLRVRQDDPSCILKDLGHCGAPCDGTQSRDDYASVAELARQAISADPRRVLTALRRRMDQLSSAGRFEKAASVRERLHAFARGVFELRRLEAIANVRRIVAERTIASGTEVIDVRGGLFHSCWVEPRADGAAQQRLGLDGIADDDGPAGDGVIDAATLEERRLVADWLEDQSVRVRHSSDALALPIEGGRQLARAILEARKLARSQRRDRQATARTKIRRREPRADVAG